MLTRGGHLPLRMGLPLTGGSHLPPVISRMRVLSGIILHTLGPGFGMTAAAGNGGLECALVGALLVLAASLFSLQLLLALYLGLHLLLPLLLALPSLCGLECALVGALLVPAASLFSLQLLLALYLGLHLLLPLLLALPSLLLTLQSLLLMLQSLLLKLLKLLKLLLKLLLQPLAILHYFSLNIMLPPLPIKPRRLVNGWAGSGVLLLNWLGSWILSSSLLSLASLLIAARWRPRAQYLVDFFGRHIRTLESPPSCLAPSMSVSFFGVRPEMTTVAAAVHLIAEVVVAVDPAPAKIA